MVSFGIKTQLKPRTFKQMSSYNHALFIMSRLGKTSITVMISVGRKMTKDDECAKAKLWYLLRWLIAKKNNKRKEIAMIEFICCVDVRDEKRNRKSQLQIGKAQINQMWGFEVNVISRNSRNDEKLQKSSMIMMKAEGSMWENNWENDWWNSEMTVT
jgi:hypothetical protein